MRVPELDLISNRWLFSSAVLLVLVLSMIGAGLIWAVGSFSRWDSCDYPWKLQYANLIPGQLNMYTVGSRHSDDGSALTRVDHESISSFESGIDDCRLGTNDYAGGVRIRRTQTVNITSIVRRNHITKQQTCTLSRYYPNTLTTKTPRTPRGYQTLSTTRLTNSCHHTTCNTGRTPILPDKLPTITLVTL